VFLVLPSSSLLTEADYLRTISVTIRGRGWVIPQLELTLLVGQRAQVCSLGRSRMKTLTATGAPWLEAEVLPALRARTARTV
jgi:hypothetical protein